MAAFKQHILCSSALGVGLGVAAWQTGIEWTHAALAGGLCGVSGMLPDLDSDSGKPVRELFGVTAAAVPFLLFHRLERAGLTAEATILVACGIYFLIRFGLAWVFKFITVHRGMFHSLPAALIAAEIAYLAHDCGVAHGRYVLAGGVLLGFLSHLVLDELYSVDASGLRIRLNKAAGSALKLASKSMVATVLTWLILGALTYLVGVDQGYVDPIVLSLNGKDYSLEHRHP